MGSRALRLHRGRRPIRRLLRRPRIVEALRGVPAAANVARGTVATVVCGERARIHGSNRHVGSGGGRGGPRHHAAILYAGRGRRYAAARVRPAKLPGARPPTIHPTPTPPVT